MEEKLQDSVKWCRLLYDVHSMVPYTDNMAVGLGIQHHDRNTLRTHNL